MVVSNRSYGNMLKGTKIYFEGPQPKRLRADGSIKFGKHILETLRSTFDRFRWVITEGTDSISTERGIVRVRTSLPLLGRMDKELWDRTRDIKNDIVRRFFAGAFAGHFGQDSSPVYTAGALAGLLERQNVLPRLSTEDREALMVFIPGFVASESVGTVNLLKAEAEIDSLTGLVKDLERETAKDHPESWWQSYIKANILLMQQGYIKAFDKLNVSLGGTKYPDFALITHDQYLDVLEIKRPRTLLLRQDPGRGNYYWAPEVSKALIQTENYLAFVEGQAAELRSYFLDQHRLDVKTVRPRGIVLAGDARDFTAQKQRDDFRLLCQGLKNVTILTYDELLVRLTNYVAVLQEFAASVPSSGRGRRHGRSAARATTPRR